jgi:hypothetical protein
MRDWADAMDAEHEAESDEEDKAATAAIDAASDAFESSIGVVLTAQPTTIAGVAALLEHVGQEEFFGMSSGGDDLDYETVLTTCHNMDGDPRKRMAQDFPLRLAATVRTMAGTATPPWPGPNSLVSSSGLGAPRRPRYDHSTYNRRQTAHSARCPGDTAPSRAAGKPGAVAADTHQDGVRALSEVRMLS